MPVVKLRDEQQVLRRFRIDEHTTFAALASHVSLAAGRKLQYCDDDGDWVELNNDADLREALAVATDTSTPAAGQAQTHSALHLRIVHRHAGASGKPPGCGDGDGGGARGSQQPGRPGAGAWFGAAAASAYASACASARGASSAASATEPTAPRMHSGAPMSWPRLSKDISDIQAHYPILVVGSGYGGAIAASRLSRAGQQVCVLERGKEMWPGDYPDTMVKAVPEMQIRTPVLPGLIPMAGRRDGLYDFRIEEGVLAWVGCGLGGGSLTNSGVAIKPDPRTFDLPQWPSALRADRDTLLRDGFDRAEAMLQPASYPGQAARPLARAKRMQEAAAKLRAAGHAQASAGLATVNVAFEARTNPAGIQQPACSLCGDCNTGCNTGSKSTVLMNYLPDAFQHGAEIYCQLEVKYIERGAGGAGWTVHASVTDPAAPRDIVITCDTLILAAGTLGTSEILLRSRTRGLPLSPQVGLGFGCDGDFFSVGYNGKSEWNGLGYGVGDSSATKRDAMGGDSGPCITSVLDMRDTAEPDVTKGYIVEDMAVPGAFVGAINGLFAGINTVEGVPTDKSTVARMAALARQTQAFKDGPYKANGSLTNSIMYGCMAYDDQAGRLSLEEDMLRIRWPEAPTKPDPAVIDGALQEATGMDSMGGSYCKNPFVPFGMRGTVHPFGGCVMGDDATSGGANHKGQVFSAAQGTDVYQDLYVCDGSLIASSLGVNPLWTISAIAERAIFLLAQDRGWHIPYSTSCAAGDTVAPPQRGVPLHRHDHAPASVSPASSGLGW